ncbi:MAG: DNA-directed RNA polymerase subunit N [Candidatus Diapherotrites archaeon]|nr:DNA-directed RNA polymerase subunit N [Candidatus Micrarchaeota archaeon]MBU1939318.1 DNA-directed RNA polymerase subunit N [Candidatus Micrarchaeota archaeon]
MIVPVRCFSCGRVVAQEYEEYLKRIQKKENPEKALDDLGIDKYCCRRTIFSHVDLVDDITKYKA